MNTEISLLEYDAFKSVMSVRDIMHKYGVSRENVMEAYESALKKVREDGPWTVADQQAAASMKKDGMSTEEIAKHMGRNVLSCMLNLSKIKNEKIRRPWTEEEDQILDELRRAGKTLEEIGSQLGRSSDAVWARANRLGNKKRTTWTREEEEVLVSMKNDGCTFLQISVSLQRSLESVRSKWERIMFNSVPGVDGREKWTKEEEERLIALKRDGKSYREIGEIIGRTRNSIKNKLYRI